MARKSSLYNNKEEEKPSLQKEVGLWHERISISKKSQESWSEDSGVNRFIKEYKGEYGISLKTRNGSVKVPPINEVFAYTQNDVASTYNRDPYISVNPKSTGSILGAKLREARLNYWWRELKIKEEIEYEIIDKDLAGLAWHKVGYAVNSVGTGEQLKIEDERLYSMWVDWKDVFWNVGSQRPPKDCQWMAQRIVRPLDDVKKQYPNAKKLEGTQDPRVDKNVYDKSLYKDDIKVCVMYEVWDARTKQVHLIAEGLNDKYLKDPVPWPDYLDEFPFLMYWDFACPGSPRPLSAIFSWEPQLLEEMVLTAAIVNGAKRDSRQIFYNGAAIDDLAADKFERGDDGAFINVNGKVGPDDLRVVSYGSMSQDYYLAVNLLQSIRRTISGSPEFAKGGVTKTGTRTVGELNLMKEGVKGRQDRKQDRLETHLENIARHMDAHLEANIVVEDEIRISGETPEDVLSILEDRIDPVTKTVKFDPDEIKGEYDIEIKAGSTLPLDKQTKMSIYEIIMQAIAPVVAQGAVSPFLNALIKEMLEGYDIKELEQAYKQEMLMHQQKQQQESGQKTVDQQKTEAEAMKRHAQAEQINTETAILEQEARIGPTGRAVVKSLEKPEPKPNGSKE